ncbi:MAG: hypothetical protein ACK4N5_06545, partial [Myxococcales bacterium]
LSLEVVNHAAPAVVISIGWLGFLFGLRFMPAQLREMPVEHRVAVAVEPLVTFALLAGMLLVAERVLDVDFRLSTIGALAAVGSGTTKSGLAWAAGRFGIKGNLSAMLQSVARLNDLPGVLIIAVYFAFRAPHLFDPPSVNLWAMLGITLVGGLLLAVLMALLLGRDALREDLAWVAVLGFAALGTGLSVRLGISALTVTTLMGVALGWFCRHAEPIARMTEGTERPIVQVLLVLIGAQLELDPTTVLVAIGITLLRAVAKLGAGASLWALRLPSARGSPWLGVGLLHSGGVVTVMVLSFALALKGPEVQLILWTFVLFSLAGDLMGSPALKSLLAWHGQLPSGPGAEPSNEAPPPPPTATFAAGGNGSATG